MNIDRKTFLGGAAAFATVGPLCGEETRPSATDLQTLIDDVTPDDYKLCRDGGEPTHAALRIYDAALTRIRREAAATVVTDTPAVWFVYNMGVIVKTRQKLFSIDLCHRRALELVPELDFALITHNHGDHYTQAFLDAMNRAGKTVVTNFNDNYGAYFKQNPGGYTRHPKTFVFGDVTVKASLSDHSAYLIDFTMPFEIHVGDHTLYHTGDSQNLDKLNPERRPDLWLVHPFCGLKTADAASKFNPKQTALVHLNELGHARDRWRWSFAQGQDVQNELAAAGFDARVPLWGDRIV